MVMSHVQLRGGPNPENPRASHKGDIVELNHVEVPQCQYALNLPPFNDWSPELVVQEKRQAPETAKGNDFDTIELAGFGRRRAFVESMECIGIIQYGRVMAAADERPTQALNINAIPTEVMWRVETCHMTEAEWFHCLASSRWSIAMRCGVSNIMPVLEIQSGFKVRVPVSPRATVGIKNLNAGGWGKLGRNCIPKRG